MSSVQEMVESKSYAITSVVGDKVNTISTIERGTMYRAFRLLNCSSCKQDYIIDYYQPVPKSCKKCYSKFLSRSKTWWGNCKGARL
jgi:hypothetical protein